MSKPGDRYVTYKIDSMNWKIFVGAGIAACAVAVLGVRDIFVVTPLEARAWLTMFGIAIVIFGVDLRRRYNRHIDREVERSINKPPF